MDPDFYAGQPWVYMAWVWREAPAVEMAIALSPGCEQKIIDVARATAELYVLQMEHVL